MRFCPVCSYFLYHEAAGGGSALILNCQHCGYNEPLAPKNSTEALVLETNFAAATAKQTVPVLNEYTKLDPTLPRLKTIACPNASCPTQADAALRDVLYVKTDAKNLKYQYACSVCSTQWGS